MGRRLNRLKIVYGYYTNKYTLDAYPMHVGIEMTNNCNLECVMCPHQRMTRKKGNMSEKLFRKIIDEIKGRAEFVYLYGMGESLLHPKFFEMASYAVKSGLTTSLSTNLTLLNEERSQKILESGIDFIVLALDGSNKDNYESVRVGGQFDKNLNQIKRFLQLKNEQNSKCYVDIQYIMVKNTKKEAAYLKSLFTEEERSAINTFRTKPVFNSPSITTEKYIHKNPCYFLWNTMTIAWDGYVVMCCMDYDGEVVLGNVRDSSVYEVWNNNKVASLRNMHKKLNYEALPLCDKCSVSEMNYFSVSTILCSAILSARTMRKLLPIYEKIFI